MRSRSGDLEKGSSRAASESRPRRPSPALSTSTRAASEARSRRSEEEDVAWQALQQDGTSAPNSRAPTEMGDSDPMRESYLDLVVEDDSGYYDQVTKPSTSNPQPSILNPLLSRPWG